jgi:CheY-like chemotaxis protein
MTMRRALYLDDDPDSCEVMKMLLSSSVQPLTVDAVLSGADALSKVAERPYDVYILDALMPGVTGFDVCRIIRQSDMNVPVIFYTGLAGKEHRAAAHDAGCTEFLIKPNDMDTLIRRVSEFIETHSTMPVPEFGSFPG